MEAEPIRRHEVATRRWALSLVALLSCFARVRGEVLPVAAFTTLDGLAHDTVRRIVPDTRGFLWFCTAGGLSRFDGHSFTTFSLEHGLPHLSINDLLETDDGELWVATNGGGVARFVGPESRARGVVQRFDETIGARRSVFERVAIGTEAAANRVNTLFEASGGELWAGTDGGLFRLQGVPLQPVFRRVALPPDLDERRLQIWSLLDDDDGGLWIGTSRGVVRLAADGRSLHHPIAPVQGTDSVPSLYRDESGLLWLGHETGLFVFAPQSLGRSQEGAPPWRQLSECDLTAGLVGSTPLDPGEACRVEGAGRGSVRVILAAADGRLWLGGGSGLVAIDGAGLRSYGRAQGLVDEALTDLAEDPAGNLWMGTLTSGAIRWGVGGFTTYTTDDGLADDWIGSVQLGADGEIYAVSAGQVIHRFDAGRFVAVRPNLPRAGRYPVALLDHSGSWWIPTGKALYRFPPVAKLTELERVGPLAAYSTRDGLAGDDVWQLFEDSRGDVWIGTRVPGREVLTRWQRRTEAFHRYSDADGLPAFSAPKSFGEDASGALWIGFWDGGLARYRSGSFSYFDADDGLPAGPVESLLTDQRGRLWVGTGLGGVGRIDDPSASRPSWQTFTRNEGLAAWSALSLQDDVDGRVYVASGWGVDRIDPQTGRIRHYTRADGFAGRPTGSSCRDSSGALWFATVRGLCRLIPQPDRVRSPPPVFLTGLRVAGAPYPLSELGELEVGGLVLAPTQNRIQVDFAGMAFAPGEVLRFRHRLQGGGDVWSQPSEERTVHYPTLVPGRYRFLVQAVTTDGLLSAAPAIVSFEILAPLWRRGWFVALSAALLAAGAALAHRARVSRVVAIERLRTSIATDLHDDLSATLTRISLLSELARRQVSATHVEAAEVLSRVGEMARALTDATRDIVWAVDPRHDDLASLVVRFRHFASDLLEAAGIRWTLGIQEGAEKARLGAGQRRQLLLILKEALHNVVRHAQASLVQVEIAVGDGRLTATVTDDGRGFEMPSSVELEEASGLGLRNMRRRAEEAGGRLVLESRPGAGASLRVEVPLE